MEPLPGWVARLAEAARRPAPAPERRLALPKAASYYTGQLWRRALPIPPVGPPPSELRRAITSERPDRSDLAGRRPRSPDQSPRRPDRTASTRRQLAVGRRSCPRPGRLAGARPPHPADPLSTPADPGATTTRKAR